MNGSLPVAAQVDLRRQPVEDVLERVEEALHVRLVREALVRKRRSLGGRTERGTWVRIERRGFERIGRQGWNGTEAAAVLQGVAMPEWYQGVAWREPGEPVMWRADELELIPSPSVGKGALVLEDPSLPDEWWEALNASLDALASQQTPRIATPDTVTITQEQVTQALGAVFPGVADTRIERWAPAHASDVGQRDGAGVLPHRLGGLGHGAPGPGRRNAVGQRACRPGARGPRPPGAACGLGEPGRQADVAVLPVEDRRTLRVRGGPAAGAGPEGSGAPGGRASALTV